MCGFQQNTTFISRIRLRVQLRLDWVLLWHYGTPPTHSGGASVKNRISNGCFLCMRDVSEYGPTVGKGIEVGLTPPPAEFSHGANAIGNSPCSQLG